MKTKNWVLVFSVLTLSLLLLIIGLVYKVDPFFHFHVPDTDTYFYLLDNERYQDSGILRNFDYDALITGTSMTENFRTSEFDDLFGVNSVKAALAGSSFKEQNENVALALRKNPKLKTIIRSIEMNFMLDEKDKMYFSADSYPTYLSDDNPFNDVKYIFNEDTFLSRILPMLSARREEGFTPGMTSFDDFNAWHFRCSYGISRFPNLEFSEPAESVALTDEERRIVLESVEQNFIALPKQYPDTTFYYFFAPYSILWWKQQYEHGTLLKHLEVEKLYIEEMLKYDNIKLFSFSNRTDLITDMNYYKDDTHYGIWVNSAILRWMHDGQYLLTPENYQAYLDAEAAFYPFYDYRSVVDQIDYENDEFAGALLNHEITGAEPIELLKDASPLLSDSASLDLESGKLLCRGYADAKITVPECKPYNFLVFYGRKAAGAPAASVEVRNAQGELLRSHTIDPEEDGKQQIIVLNGVAGEVSFVFSAVPESSDAQNAEYVFSDITLY